VCVVVLPTMNTISNSYQLLCVVYGVVLHVLSCWDKYATICFVYGPHVSVELFRKHGRFNLAIQVCMLRV
jgi:hypothetical protein